MTLEEMAREFAQRCAECNNLPIEVEHLLHTAFIAGYNESALKVTNMEIQDNVSKAREIELDVYVFGEKPKGEFEAPAYRAALAMAEWKDKQFKEILKEECNTSYESGLSEGERKAEVRFKEYLEKKQSELDGTSNKSNYELLDEIINELFKED